MTALNMNVILNSDLSNRSECNFSRRTALRLSGSVQGMLVGTEDWNGLQYVDEVRWIRMGP